MPPRYKNGRENDEGGHRQSFDPLLKAAREVVRFTSDASKVISAVDRKLSGALDVALTWVTEGDIALGAFGTVSAGFFWAGLLSHKHNPYEGFLFFGGAAVAGTMTASNVWSRIGTSVSKTLLKAFRSDLAFGAAAAAIPTAAALTEVINNNASPSQQWKLTAGDHAAMTLAAGIIVYNVATRAMKHETRRRSQIGKEMLAAIDKADIGQVRILLGKGVDPNQEVKGYTLFSHSISFLIEGEANGTRDVHRRAEIAALLLAAQKTNPNIGLNHSTSYHPFAMAIEQGSFMAVRLLLESEKVNVDQVYKGIGMESYPVELAVNRPVMLRFLLSSGRVDPTPLVFHAIRAEDVVLLSEALETGRADLARTKEGHSPLYYASLAVDRRLISTLIDYGARLTSEEAAEKKAREEALRRLLGQ